MTHGLPASISELRLLLKRNLHDAFLSALSAALEDTHAVDRDVLRVLGGEGLARLLRTLDSASDQTCLRYLDQLAAGNIDPIPGDLVLVTQTLLPRVEHCLDTTRTAEILRTLVNLKALESGQVRIRSRRTEPVDPTPLQLRRLVQVIDFKLDKFPSSDALGLKQSVFKSPQERSFLRALSLRFPGLIALPNYGLNQLFDGQRLKEMVDYETWSYALRCVLDAVLIVPDEGDPVAVFELDSAWHDSPERHRLDERKDALLKMIQIPLVRLRVEDSASMTTDEWYALLTDQVLDRISCGTRIAARHSTVSLVPVGAHR